MAHAETVPVVLTRRDNCLSCGQPITADLDHLKAVANAQRFFAQLALEARKPSFGEQASGWTRSLLIRAEEAGLFDPKET